MKKIILLIIAGYLPVVLSAQRANNWYFGSNAGLDFNNGAPVALSNGALSTQEGCSAISDMNGNLLFYTDGVNVYSKTHSVMPNGTGLLGGSSSTQSALIIPVPGSSILYDVFTISQQQSFDGLNYSQVDMSLNGGNGDVINKNTVLYPFPATEKLAAVYQANGTDVWVAIHLFNSDAFYVYPVTSSGIAAPVISNSGMVHNGSNSEMGYMKFSPDGNKLALAITGSNKLEIFDFDKSTGIVSNPISYTPSLGNFAYGVEFSPDASKLYLMTDDTPGRIYQFDMNAGSPSAILASAQLIHTSNENGGAMQTGPDGKIYFVRNWSNTIGVINNPNAAGSACNPVANGATLGGTIICQIGLPNFLSNYFYGTTGIEDHGQDVMLTISPNPFSDKLNVSIDTKDISEITLYDILSQKHFQQKFTGTVLLNTEQLAKGIYMYEVRDKEGAIRKGKLIKQ